jgi:hypothetical protein
MVQDEKAIEEIIFRGMEGRDAPGGVVEMAHPRFGTEYDCANPRQSETEVHVLIRRGAMQKEIGELVDPLEGGAPNEAVASAQPIAPAGLAGRRVKPVTKERPDYASLPFSIFHAVHQPEVESPGPRGHCPCLVVEVRHDRHGAGLGVECLDHLLDAPVLELHVVIEKEQQLSARGGYGGLALTDGVWR